MKLTGLLDRFDESPALQDLSRQIASTGSAQAAAMVEGVRPAVASYLARKLGGSLVFVTGHPHRADYLAGEIAPFRDSVTEGPPLLFPAFENLPYERAPLDLDMLARRQAVVNHLSRRPAVVVTSMRALLQSVSLPKAEQGSLDLRVGHVITLDELIARLAEGGYEPAPLVEEVGTFARRGGLFDVFPVGASHPVRIELLGNEIDSLRIFDPVNQRSMNKIDAVRIEPLRQLDQQLLESLAGELADLPTDNLTESGLDVWLSDLERLQRGETEDTQLFQPYLNSDASVIDAARMGSPTPPLILFEDCQELRQIAADLFEKACRIQEELAGSGALPAGLKPGLIDPSGLFRSLNETTRMVDFTRGGDEQSVEARVFTRPRAFGGRVRDFLHFLDPVSGDQQAQDALVLTSFQHARLAELLEAENVHFSVTDDVATAPEPGTITIVRGSLAEGWSASGLGIEVFSDHEVFGWSKPRAATRRRRAPRETFFTEFTPGDYVVHIEHGIGQLVGTEKMSQSGTAANEREYLIVQYAGTDRLYVPTDQLDRLTRYVGMGEAKPHLNKLGGQEWTRAKARAKQAAEDMAEELIALYAKRESEGGHAFSADTPWQSELEGSFPFEETPDQMQAIVDVKGDMEQERPMDRLVVADVGYGKTEVAVRAAFKAVLDGVQVAVLVPTTVLAQQHLETFRERLEAFPVRVEMLSRFRSPKEQKEVLRKAREGDVDVVIGTHRLLGKDVQFKDLGLLVIDEEQRFGVRHKERLKQLRAAVDVLTLTATPIPRTLHMSLTGIRDVSIIQTPPEGRLPIRTFLQPYEDRLVREAIVREMEREGQVFFVHNRVAGIEVLAEKLRTQVPEARLLVGHGQMAEDQLEKVMLAFSHQEADVLLCSTIIESGLDIPNVNTIIIDHAEALGLAQLYQLRGRVGRGVNQAFAYLLYPRDARIGQDAMRRMEAVFEATELGAGFRIAMTDLEIRGAGNLLGSEQSGHVAAIGFDLYTNLLKDAIERQRGQVQVERPNVMVELPFDILIPEAYVTDERERLALYRRLATIDSPEQLLAIEDELRDRFGPLPEAVNNLLTQVQVKFLAQEAHVAMVALRGDRLTIRGEKRILFDRVGLYKRFGMTAKIDENTLRIEANALKPDWLQAIKDMLSDTAALRKRQEAALNLAAESRTA